MFQQIETEREAMNELPPFLFNTMNTKLGLHVGIKEKIPHIWLPYIHGKSLMVRSF
jgi:hypothetical protein